MSMAAAAEDGKIEKSPEVVPEPAFDEETAKKIEQLKSRIAEMELQSKDHEDQPLYDSSEPMERQLDLSDPDRLREYMIFLRLPKSGAPRNYEKWYRSFIPVVVSDDPDNIPRLTRAWKPQGLMPAGNAARKPQGYGRKPQGCGCFQAMLMMLLSPRQMQDPEPGFEGHGSFQAVLSPRQVQDMMKLPHFDYFVDVSSDLIG